MSFASPWALATAALAAPLVLWYVLRSRRPRVTVASTFLWRTSERSVAAAVPWQRFRPDTTFWLTLLALLLGAVALAGPYVQVPAQLGDHTIVIVDTSASMLADEEGPTRLELARREAESLLDRMAPGQLVSVIEAGGRARVLASASDDPSLLRDALRSLRPTHGRADLADAFTVAAALERPAQSTVVHLLTDGALPDDAEPIAPAGLRVTAVGSDRPNLAVTRLETVALGAGTNQAFVQVRNFGSLDTRARIQLTVGGTEVVERDVRIGPRGTHDEVLQVSGDEGDVLVASVEPVGAQVTGRAATDALSVDDRAFALLAAPRDLSVLLATPGNVFLEAALRSVPGVEVTVAERVPPELDASDLDDIDLIVVDRVAAPDPLPAPTLLVAPTRPPAGITTGDEVELPALTYQAPDHELLTDVDLSDVGVAVANDVEAPALTTVAASPDTPLIMAGRIDTAPTVLVTFDLLQSNLPLRASWPVFVSNAVGWLAAPPVAPPTVAGSAVSLSVPAGTETVAVSPPSGDTIELDPVAPRFVAEQVGVWRLDFEPTPTSGAAPTAVAVNPDAEESDLARERPAIQGGREGVTGPDVEGDATGRRSLWREAVAIVLVLLVAEWLWTQSLSPWRRRRRERRSRESARDRVPVGTGRQR